MAVFAKWFIDSSIELSLTVNNYTLYDHTIINTFSEQLIGSQNLMQSNECISESNGLPFRVIWQRRMSSKKLFLTLKHEIIDHLLKKKGFLFLIQVNERYSS